MAERCTYCNRRVFAHNTAQVRSDPWCQSTRDHRFPKYLCKACNVTDVLVVACRGCNMAKGQAPAEVFEFFIRQKPYSPPGNMRKVEFEAFVFQLAIAGYRSARAHALGHRWHVSAPRRDRLGRLMRATPMPSGAEAGSAVRASAPITEHA